MEGKTSNLLATALTFFNSLSEDIAHFAEWQTLLAC